MGYDVVHVHTRTRAHTHNILLPLAPCAWLASFDSLMVRASVEFW